jgi:hypothetical protein
LIATIGLHQPRKVRVWPATRRHPYSLVFAFPRYDLARSLRRLTEVPRHSSESLTNRHHDMTEVPLGHSRVAHSRLGFCSHCRGKTAADEVAAWRTWALALEQYGRELLVAEGRLSTILEAVSRLVERRRDRGEQR